MQINIETKYEPNDVVKVKIGKGVTYAKITEANVKVLSAGPTVMYTLSNGQVQPETTIVKKIGVDE